MMIFSNTNIVFFVVMLVIFGYSALAIGRGQRSKFAKDAPTLLTSLGILGTFVGIVMALYGFDDNNIKAHINQIIAGMQTAFYTSVVGVASSIALKMWVLYKNKEGYSDDDIVEYTVGLFEIQNEHLHSQTMSIDKQTKAALELLKNNQEQHALFENQARAIDGLTRAIGSDSENSLVGQITRLRNDNNDNHKSSLEFHKTAYEQFSKQLLTQLHHLSNQEQAHQNQCFDRLHEKLDELYIQVQNHQDKRLTEFAGQLFNQLDKVSEIISKSATEQVINALKEVISDFNHNLTEQFGENFKELNQAVFKLVEWQDNYAHQIDAMVKQYEQGVLAIESTKTAVMAIENSTQAIPNTMNDLSKIITVNQHQIDELNRHLHAFGELQAKATQALPETQQHIELMIKGIQDGSKDLINSLNTTNDMIKIQIASVENHSEQFKIELNKIAKNFENYVQETNDAQLKEMKKLLDGLNQSAQNALKATGESIKKQIEALDEAQQKELEQVMQSMGQALATITGKFTDDYGRLVAQMNKVVRMYNPR
ncbi:MAG: MotA/TolQ/ExbB proton channel family protein [Moraxella sp.]|nr:MotA/TolQ/ExbB proton channel family protein [Moraxella sp.]